MGWSILVPQATKYADSGNHSRGLLRAAFGL
jgi:hypothetical protein